MDLLTLCNQIDLQPEIKGRVLAFENKFDFNTIDLQLKDFSDYNKMKQAHTELKRILGEDKDHIKILTCMLKASAAAYEKYQEKGIHDDVYFATMKCYTRFIDETYQRTGKLFFDRDWWTIRQAGCHLFRIGALEYEIKRSDPKITIALHIPSDADFSPESVDRSLERAKVCLAQYDPETQGADYVCRSWLLDRQLQGMLKEASNIVDFQKRFEILDAGTASTGFLSWVFKRDAVAYADLPEDTSLQRNMKQHLLAGGVVREAFGRIK